MSEWQGEEGDHWAANADRYTRMLEAFGDVVAEAAGFRPGERVLDIGCGCGDVSLLAGGAVGASGFVQGIDLSPAMVDVATARAADAGLGNVAFAAADAATFRPGKAGFDVLVSRFGVMFFDDPVGAFTNLRSLLAPGGRLAFVCWQDLVANAWMLVPGLAAAQVLPLPTGGDPAAPGPFAFADSDRVTSLLTAAGFGETQAMPASARLWLGETAAETAAFLRTTGMGRTMFADADPETVDTALSKVTEALVAHETEGGVELDGAAWLVTASA